MSEIASGRSSVAQTVIVSFATLAALTLLGVVLAYWTWEWLAPRPEPRALPAVKVAERTMAAQTLFGSAQKDGQAGAMTGMPIKLLGVVASADKRNGYAVVQIEGQKVLAVREGEDVSPGISLAEVHPDRVVLVRNGARETLAWPQKKR